MVILGQGSAGWGRGEKGTQAQAQKGHGITQWGSGEGCRGGWCRMEQGGAGGQWGARRPVHSISTQAGLVSESPAPHRAGQQHMRTTSHHMLTPCAPHAHHPCGNEDTVYSKTCTALFTDVPSGETP